MQIFHLISSLEASNDVNSWISGNLTAPACCTYRFTHELAERRWGTHIQETDFWITACLMSLILLNPSSPSSACPDPLISLTTVLAVKHNVKEKTGPSFFLCSVSHTRFLDNPACEVSLTSWSFSEIKCMIHVKYLPNHHCRQSGITFGFSRNTLKKWNTRLCYFYIYLCPL